MTESGVVNPDKELMSRFTPLAAAPRLVRASAIVPAPVPPCAIGTSPAVTLPPFKPVNPEPSPLKLPTNLLAALDSTLTPLIQFDPVKDAPPTLTSALEVVAAPVPPWMMDKGMLSAVNELISAFAPLAAAPKLARAPAGFAAPVPPRASGSSPLEILRASK